MGLRLAQGGEFQAPQVRQQLMAGLLLSGPAGAGKSRRARAELAGLTRPGLIIDFQALLAALTLLERDAETGRYPERTPEDNRLLPTVEFTRQSLIRRAVAAELFVIATNSDGNTARRGDLLALLGPDASEQILDPGIDVVKRRLSVNGRLSGQCEQAISRWYGRLT